MASSINASTAGAGGVITTADNSGVLNLQTAGSTAINVTSGQLVNIGTTTSSGQLTVKASSGQGTPLNLSATDAGANVQVVFTGNRTYQVGTGNSSSGFTDVLYFYDGTAGAERMRLNSSGQFLLATTSGTMSVTGKAPVQRIYNASTSILGLEAGSTATYNVILFNNPNGEVGVINTSGSVTIYGTTSDYRLKTNVQPMQNALETVSKLNPVTYTWKVDNSAGQGFIAHELQEVVPNCVSGEKDAVNENGSIKPQNIDTSYLVATLTAAIQELNAKVDAQAAEIAALKAGA